MPIHNKIKLTLTIFTLDDNKQHYQFVKLNTHQARIDKTSKLNNHTCEILKMKKKN